MFVLMLNAWVNSYGYDGTVETDVNCVLRRATCYTWRHLMNIWSRAW